MLDLASEAGLDLTAFARLMDSDESRMSVLAEAKIGRTVSCARDTHAHASGWKTSAPPDGVSALT